MLRDRGSLLSVPLPDGGRRSRDSRPCRPVTTYHGWMSESLGGSHDATGHKSLWQQQEVHRAVGRPRSSACSYSTSSRFRHGPLRLRPTVVSPTPFMTPCEAHVWRQSWMRRPGSPAGAAPAPRGPRSRRERALGASRVRRSTRLRLLALLRAERAALQLLRGRSQCMPPGDRDVAHGLDRHLSKSGRRQAVSDLVQRLLRQEHLSPVRVQSPRERDAGLSAGQGERRALVQTGRWAGAGRSGIWLYPRGSWAGKGCGERSSPARRS